MWASLVAIQMIPGGSLGGQPVGGPQNSPEMVIRVAAEARLTPAAVAAIGLDGPGAVELVADIRESTALAESLQSARDAAAAARDTVREIAVDRRLNPTGVSRATLGVAESALATSRDQLAAARDQAAGSLFQEFGADASDRARAIAAQSDVVQPPALWVVPRDGPSARSIHLALIAERRAARQGRPVPGACQAVLASARSDYRVVAAQTLASQNTAAVAAAMAGMGQP